MAGGNRRGVALGSAAGVVAGALLGRVFSRGGGSRTAVRATHKMLGDNLQMLSTKERKLVDSLAATGYGHLFRSWPRAGTRDNAKRALLVAAAGGMDELAAGLEAQRLEVLQPPQPEKRPHQLKHVATGEVREDPYYWFRDDERKDPNVIAHLNAETAYCKAALADTEALQEELYKEMRGRIQEDDESVPVRDGGYYYYTRTIQNTQYRVHCRRAVPDPSRPPAIGDKLDTEQKEEILLDENKEASGHSFYMVGAFEVSPDHKLLCYAVDTQGGEKFTLYVKNLQSGKQLLAKPIPDTAGDAVWANDNKTLFYVTKDKLDRPYKVWRHTVGSTPGSDELVFHEEDEAFYVGVNRSRSEDYIFIGSGSAVTSEVLFLNANRPNGTFKAVLPRVNDVEYSVTHRGAHFYITLRDKDRPNSELLVSPVEEPAATAVLMPHRQEVKIEGVSLCKDYITMFERKKGLQVATVYGLPADGSVPKREQLAPWDGREVAMDQPAYELSSGSQGDFDSKVLRLVFSSLATPTSVMDVDMVSMERQVKKVQPVLGGFDQNKYKTLRLWAVAEDQTKVPISLVYREDLVKLDGSDPMLLDCYGSYEVCNDPYFSSTRLTLIDRGFVFAVAHVRGGGEMGRHWYEDGKFLHKKHTFTDLISCAEHLVREKYTSPARLCIEGRSAGGLTMGAVLNMRPDLFKAAIMGVPFVDVLTTMLDETIPLTVIEFEEWGNPAEAEYYHYMKSYSPVDNIQAAAYPNILITAGLHDPRVGYWEPAKFCALLREQKTDDNLLLFKCDMGAGHFSQSGRFDRLKEVALEHAFLLKCLGMLQTPAAK